MRLTVYGRSVVVKVLTITLIIDIIAIFIPDLTLKLILLIVSVLFFSFTLFFFRDPIRNLPEGIKKNDIVSPADGRVMMIEDVEDNLYLKSKAKLIGIFLSPLDVHVNRIPVSGKVDYFEYVKGKYIAAFEPKSSELNERTLIGISNGDFKLLFKQIAGFVARRIVCNLKLGDYVRAGEKFGMIRFGSRVDLIVPQNINIKVSVKQKVVGGETIIACLPSALTEVL
ncbi:MAG: phosphatidylserine decarboxylase family protein [Ignavibacteria bacterium]